MRWGIGCPKTLPVSRAGPGCVGCEVVERSVGTWLSAEKCPAKRPACTKTKMRDARKRRALREFHNASGKSCCDMGHRALLGKLGGGRYWPTGKVGHLSFPSRLAQNL